MTSARPPVGPPVAQGTQYLRKAQLYVANDTEGLDLSQMHFQFSIKQWVTATPNIAEIRVWNLATDTATKIQREFAKVVLNAGYEGTTVNTIFSGNIVQVRRGREDPADTYTDMTCLDGDISYSWGIVSQTLAAGSEYVDRVNAIAKSMGLPIGYIGSIPDHTQQLPRGKAIFGMGRDHLDDQAKQANMNWSIQNGKFELVEFGGYKQFDAVELNSATGLIGYPEQTQEGLKVRCLLNSKLQISCLIHINNTFIHELELGVTQEQMGSGVNAAPLRPSLNEDGLYRILVLEHSGDTRGQEYYSDMICVSAAVGPDGEQQIIPSLAQKGYVPKNNS